MLPNSLISKFLQLLFSSCAFHLNQFNILKVHLFSRLMGSFNHQKLAWNFRWAFEKALTSIAIDVFNLFSPNSRKKFFNFKHKPKSHAMTHFSSLADFPAKKTFIPHRETCKKSELQSIVRAMKVWQYVVCARKYFIVQFRPWFFFLSY